QDSEVRLVAWAPLAFEQLPLGPSDRRGDSRFQSIHAVHEGPFRLASRRSDRRKVESANRPGERVDVKISFEEARAVRDGEEPGLRGVPAESIYVVSGDPVRRH